MASLIDTAGDFAVAMVGGGGVLTMNCRVDYLRPFNDVALRAATSARRVGRSVAVVDIDVRHDQGRRCAIGRGICSVSIGLWCRATGMTWAISLGQTDKT